MTFVTSINVALGKNHTEHVIVCKSKKPPNYSERKSNSR
jgi:hypothetical protein